MYFTSLLLFFIGGMVQESKARSLHLSVNLSLALNDEQQQQQQQEHQTSSNISTALVHSCMKETELSMNELRRFHLGSVINDEDTVNGIQDPNEESGVKTFDYDSTLSMIEERNEESLQCFIHCLYEKLGMIKNGIFVEGDFFRKLYAIVGQGTQSIPECISMESSNNCETAYKMHLCYSKIKNLEAERHIRKLIEESENGYINSNNETDDVAGDGSSSVTTDLSDYDAVDPKENEIDKN